MEEIDPWVGFGMNGETLEAKVVSWLLSYPPSDVPKDVGAGNGIRRVGQSRWSQRENEVPIVMEHLVHSAPVLGRC